MGWSWSGWPEEDVALSEIVIVKVPEGVITGGGGVTAAVGLPPPQPAKASVKQRIREERTTQRARLLLRPTSWNASRCLLKNANRKSRASRIGACIGTREVGGKRRRVDGGKTAGPLVVTVTVSVAGPLASETLAGTWQRAPRGTPVQLIETVPVKPAFGVS